MKRKDALWVMQMCRDRDARSEAEREAFDTAIEALQTGIVHCEECGWWQKQDDSLQGRCAKYKFYPTGRYFCAGGERSEE